MKQDSIITSARVSMLQGRRMTQKQIIQHEAAIRQQLTDDRVEVMMLFMAEALHDIAGYGMKRTARILKNIDERMVEFLEDGFDIDALRVRVFGKTNFMFACDPEEQKHVAEVLKAAGYDVKMEGEDNGKTDNRRVQVS